MKGLILLVIALSFSGCASLITTSDVKSCCQKCGSKEKVKQLSKQDGNLSCTCK